MNSRENFMKLNKQIDFRLLLVRQFVISPGFNQIIPIFFIRKVAFMVLVTPSFNK
jgi:hypothetical protein